jgi:hypothetical protein
MSVLSDPFSTFVLRAESAKGKCLRLAHFDKRGTVLDASGRADGVIRWFSLLQGGLIGERVPDGGQSFALTRPTKVVALQ